MIHRWKKINTKSLVKNDWIHLTEDSYLCQDHPINWYLFQGHDSVIVFTKTTSNQIVLVKQYRPGTDDIHWEFPAGSIDANEGGPLVAAKRELFEETGYSGESAQIIEKLTIDSSRHTEYCYGVFIDNAKLVSEKKLDLFEEIEVGLFTPEQVMELIKKREIVVGTQIAFFFLAIEQGLFARNQKVIK